MHKVIGIYISAESHVVRMVSLAYDAAKTLGKSHIALDRYFLTVPALKKLHECNQNEHLLDTITRAKSNCIAFEEPPVCIKRSKGRSAKKGKSVKLQTLFETHQAQFIEKSFFLYGEEETVSYYCTDLLWGAKLYQKLRFFLRSQVGAMGSLCAPISTRIRS